jgi:hypothetical protein
MNKEERKKIEQTTQLKKRLLIREPTGAEKEVTKASNVHILWCDIGTERN